MADDTNDEKKNPSKSGGKLTGDSTGDSTGKPAAKPSAGKNAAKTAATKPDPKNAPPSATRSEAPSTPPSSGRFSMVLAIAVVLAALVGGGVAAWPFVYPYVEAYLPVSNDDPFKDARFTSLAEKVNELESAARSVRTHKSAIQDLEDARKAYQTDLSALIGRLGETEQALGTMRKMVEATTPPGEAADASQSLRHLASRLTDLEKSGEALDALLQRITQLEKGATTLNSGTSENAAADASGQRLDRSITEISSRLENLEKKNVSGAASPEAQRAVLAIGRMREVLRSSAPFVETANILKAAAVDSADVARALAMVAPYAMVGIPEMSALRDRFDDEAGKIAAAAGLMAGKGWVARAVNALAGLVRVRRTGGDTKEMSPVEKALVTAEQALDNGDLSLAISALEGLSGDPLATATSWLDDAHARQTAERAMAILHVQALSQLSPTAKDKAP